MKATPTVLFVCTGNSIRSQMAEVILRKYAGDRIEVYSAGLSPRSIDPLTLQVLAEHDLDTKGLYSKPIDLFLGKKRLSYAIIVCEQAEQNCPRIFPFALQRLYWPFPSPSAQCGSASERLANFRAVFELIDARIQAWLTEEFGADSGRQTK